MKLSLPDLGLQACLGEKVMEDVVSQISYLLIESASEYHITLLLAIFKQYHGRLLQMTASTDRMTKTLQHEDTTSRYVKAGDIYKIIILRDENCYE